MRRRSSTVKSAVGHHSLLRATTQRDEDREADAASIARAAHANASSTTVATGGEHAPRLARGTDPLGRVRRADTDVDAFEPLARGTDRRTQLPDGVTVVLPPGFVLVDCEVERTDRHDAGKHAAQRALALLAPGSRLAYDGTQPVAIRAPGDREPLAISITHTRRRAFALAGRVERLGIDLVDDIDDDRYERMAPRYLDRELSFAHTPRQVAACFAGKEAGLKALGLGLLDGGMFDACEVDVLALEPARIATRSSGKLALVFGRTEDGTLAIAWR